MTQDQSNGKPAAPSAPDKAVPPEPPANAKRIPSKREQESRRRFLRSVAAGFVILGTALTGLYPVMKRIKRRLRPPGAIDEDKFLAACIKCGQCVQVCPVVAIKLADVDEGFGIGVPYIDARDQACDFSCDATQCVLACPTGALDHAITKKEEVTMGFAHLVEPDHCLAMQGQGFKGLARGADFKGLLRYEEIDRWTPDRGARARI